MPTRRHVVLQPKPTTEEELEQPPQIPLTHAAVAFSGLLKDLLAAESEDEESSGNNDQYEEITAAAAGGEDAEDLLVPLPNITTSTLALIVQYLEHHGELLMADPTYRIRSIARPVMDAEGDDSSIVFEALKASGVGAWDRDVFVKQLLFKGSSILAPKKVVDAKKETTNVKWSKYEDKGKAALKPLNTLIEVANAANFLAINSLVNLCSVFLAACMTHLYEFNPEVIAKSFLVKSDGDNGKVIPLFTAPESVANDGDDAEDAELEARFLPADVLSVVMSFAVVQPPAAVILSEIPELAEAVSMAEPLWVSSGTNQAAKDTRGYLSAKLSDQLPHTHLEYQRSAILADNQWFIHNPNEMALVALRLEIAPDTPIGFDNSPQDEAVEEESEKQKKRYDFYSSHIGTKDVEVIAKHLGASMRVFKLGDCTKLTAAAGIHFKTLRHVVDLRLTVNVDQLTEESTVDLAGIVFPNMPQLEVLTLKNSELASDTAVAIPKYLKHLRSLDLEGGHIKLMRNFPKLYDAANKRASTTHAAAAVDNAAIFFRSLNDECKELKRLELSACSGVTRAAADAIAESKSLVNLGLEYSLALTPEAFAKLGAQMSQLEEMNLAGCTRTSNEDIEHLSKLSHLTSLNLGDCKQISMKGCAAMANGLTSLRTLKMRGCTKVAGAEMETLCSGAMKTLSVLDVSECDRIPSEPLGRAIANFSYTLTSLNLAQTTATDATLESLSTLKRLKYLNVSHCELTDMAFTTIGGSFRNIEELIISGTDVTDVGFMFLIGLQDSLQVLHMDMCKKVSQVTFETHLVKMTKLVELSVKNNACCTLRPTSVTKLIPALQATIPSLTSVMTTDSTGSQQYGYGY